MVVGRGSSSLPGERLALGRLCHKGEIHIRPIIPHYPVYGPSSHLFYHPIITFLPQCKVTSSTAKTCYKWAKQSWRRCCKDTNQTHLMSSVMLKSRTTKECKSRAPTYKVTAICAVQSVLKSKTLSERRQSETVITTS